MLAMDVNDDAFILNVRGDLGFIAALRRLDKPAPCRGPPALYCTIHLNLRPPLHLYRDIPIGERHEPCRTIKRA